MGPDYELTTGEIVLPAVRKYFSRNARDVEGEGGSYQVRRDMEKVISSLIFKKSTHVLHTRTLRCRGCSFTKLIIQHS